MRDRLFSGADVDEALAAAAASLGLPIAELRYLVLDPGGPGGRGLNATPARIAVMVQDRPAPSGAGSPRRFTREAASRPAAGPAAGPAAPPIDVKAGVRTVVQALAEAGPLDLTCEIDEEEAALLVRLGGADAAFFLGEDGKGGELRALEHLLQRTYGPQLYPRWLRLEVTGSRERRAQALAEEARAMAAAVRQDGRPRSLEPMNSYERRLVHIALQGEPGVTTYSEGEGTQRRVTIGPAVPGRDEAAGPGPGETDGR
ncbi:MAG TPA: R3H domain-containing nucleic acid-binding protein [Vicinamibacteria bacterium]|nr:R3H domain-containing nucleic acid-binding protein [Vicinamibacteria bacterium]